MSLYEKHRDRLERAVEACAARHAWSPFIESPSRRLHPDGARESGLAEFESLLGKPFPMTAVSDSSWVGEEVSPYTNEPLGITYPGVGEIDALFEGVTADLESWVAAGPRTRVGVCMEILDRLAGNVFANAYATMHTAGQAYMMAFAGSGANSLDRGLEALAQAHVAMSAIPESATYERSFGGAVVRMHKTYRLRPRGVALVITCASYPAWNAYPAIFANLATGNPVIVKPHPGGTLPMAMAVRIGREVLAEQGFDPNLLVLAADSSVTPVTKALATHERTAIVDFTGSAGFGEWLEQNCRQALVYTETAGCNAVVVESTNNLDGMLHAIGQSIALFSSQMCTAAQNIFVPEDGVKTNEGTLSADEFATRLTAVIERLMADPTHASAICGALQSERVRETIGRASAQAEVLLQSRAFVNPEYPAARTATPVVLRERQPHTVARCEWFGPIAFVLPVPDRNAALELAARDAQECGAIASYLYTTDAEYLAAAQDAFARAGASLGVNLIGQLPINFAAAYSDYHVTGLNPAGTACLTDVAFVANRFRVVQTKVEL